MANIYGNQFGSDRAKLAQGASHDAAVRRHSNSVDLAVEGGGTADTLIAARLREGCSVCAIDISCTTNASGITFGVGTAAAATKYGAAVTGPAAGATVRVAIPVAVLDDILTANEEIILTPSGNLPATGILVASVYASHK